MIEIEVLAKPNVVLVSYKNDFVIFSRHTNEAGFGSATFSFPVTAQIANRLESSKIIRVEKASADGILVFSRLPFYTTEKATEIFGDIIEYIQQ